MRAEQSWRRFYQLSGWFAIAACGLAVFAGVFGGYQRPANAQPRLWPVPIPELKHARALAVDQQNLSLLVFTRSSVWRFSGEKREQIFDRAWLGHGLPKQDFTEILDGAPLPDGRLLIHYGTGLFVFNPKDRSSKWLFRNSSEREKGKDGLRFIKRCAVGSGGHVMGLIVTRDYDDLSEDAAWDSSAPRRVELIEFTENAHGTWSQARIAGDGKMPPFRPTAGLAANLSHLDDSPLAVTREGNFVTSQALSLLIGERRYIDRNNVHIPTPMFTIKQLLEHIVPSGTHFSHWPKTLVALNNGSYLIGTQDGAENAVLRVSRDGSDVRRLIGRSAEEEGILVPQQLDDSHWPCDFAAAKLRLKSRGRLLLAPAPNGSFFMMQTSDQLWFFDNSQDDLVANEFDVALHALKNGNSKEVKATLDRWSELTHSATTNSNQYLAFRLQLARWVLLERIKSNK